jgi:hypothetical protein
MPKEAVITINGQTLTVGQSMALRVAVTNYHGDMSEPGALGKDSMGEGIRQGYLARLSEILEVILR